MDRWNLAIDFGTTYTCAAMAIDGRVELVQFGPSPQLPSSVLRGQDGNLVVGELADNQAVLDPSRYERTPKRRVGDPSLTLGDHDVPLVEVVGAVLAVAAREARRQRGDQLPTRVCLTYPAGWARAKREVLVAAAAAAGLGGVELLSEPVAAAVHFAGAARVGEGEHVAVYDLGGGTLDTAVLRRTGAGFEVQGQPLGRDPLGGEDFDQAIIDHLSREVIGEDDEDWQRLLAGADRTWRRHARDLRLQVRKAKEALSELEAYDLWVPGLDRTVHLTKGELWELIGPDVDLSVTILGQTITRAGLTPSALAGIYLAGGSSRIPLVQQRIWERLERQPVTLDQPKTVVAQGAARWLAEYAAPGVTPPLPPPEEPTAQLPPRDERPTADDLPVVDVAAAKADGGGRDGDRRANPLGNRALMVGGGLIVLLALLVGGWRLLGDGSPPPPTPPPATPETTPPTATSPDSTTPDSTTTGTIEQPALDQEPWLSITNHFEVIRNNQSSCRPLTENDQDRSPNAAAEVRCDLPNDVRAYFASYENSDKLRQERDDEVPANATRVQLDVEGSNERYGERAEFVRDGQPWIFWTDEREGYSGYATWTGSQEGLLDWWNDEGRLG